MRLAGLIDFTKAYISKEVAQLREGTSFGEIALQFGSALRQATIYSKEVCLVAYLERAEY